MDDHILFAHFFSLCVCANAILRSAFVGNTENTPEIV